jgi:glycosylphosphatidylinositol transamidase (GPIT) subunit GPI8
MVLLVLLENAQEESLPDRSVGQDVLKVARQALLRGLRRRSHHADFVKGIATVNAFKYLLLVGRNNFLAKAGSIIHSWTIFNFDI